MKSPPELWAELSELESLARHLGEFGEIRITKVDPESRVEWEADRASGTVRLEPSGWGTRVVFTVDTPEPEPVVAQPVAEEPDPEPVAVSIEPVAAEPEPVAAEPEPVEIELQPEPEPPAKRGWFARLFRRTSAAPVPMAPQAAEPVADVTPAHDAVAESPAPAAVHEPEPVERATFGPLTVAEAARAAEEEAAARNRSFGTIEWETPEQPVVEEPEPAPIDPDEAHAVLTGVLDALGAAHHRPFSR